MTLKEQEEVVQLEKGDLFEATIIKTHKSKNSLGKECAGKNLGIFMVEEANKDQVTAKGRIFRRKAFSINKLDYNDFGYAN